MRVTIAGCGVLLAVSTAYWIGSRSPAPAAAETAASDATVRQRAVPSRSGPRDWRPRARDVDGASGVPVPSEPIEAASPTPEEWLERRIAVLEETLRERPRDAWAAETEVLVHERFRDGDLGDEIDLDDVVCVEGLCKMVFHFTGEGLLEGREQLQKRMPRTPPFNARTFMHCPEGYASRACTTYFTRKGERMPRPERT